MTTTRRWEFVESEDTMAIHEQPESDTDNETIAIVRNSPECRDRCRSNGKIMAAAPDLLDAAKSMVDWADRQAGGRAGRPEIVALRNAIDKAEGTS